MSVAGKVDQLIIEGTKLPLKWEQPEKYDYYLVTHHYASEWDSLLDRNLNIISVAFFNEEDIIKYSKDGTRDGNGYISGEVVAYNYWMPPLSPKWKPAEYPAPVDWYINENRPVETNSQEVMNNINLRYSYKEENGPEDPMVISKVLKIKFTGNPSDITDKLILAPNYVDPDSDSLPRPEIPPQEPDEGQPPLIEGDANSSSEYFEFINKNNTMKAIQGKDIVVSFEIDGDAEFDSAGAMFSYQLHGQDIEYVDKKVEITTSNTGKKRIWTTFKMP